MDNNADNMGEGVRVRRAKKGAAARSRTVVSAGEEGAASMELTAAAPKPSPFLAGASIRYGDITAFLRQLIMMLDAGTPLLRTLKTLSQRGEKKTMRALVTDIAQYVEMGNPLWQAFERHPKYFDLVFVSLIKASEASGTLGTVLQRMVQYREQRDTLRKRLRAGLLYPVILTFVCFGVVVFIAKVIIPEFEDLFAKFEVELTPLTHAFMGTAKAIGNYWWVAVVAAAALIAVYKLWYVRNPLRRLRADRMKLKLPIVGRILLKNAIVEMTRTMAMLLRSGLSMMATLELVRNSIHNRAVSQVVQNMRDSVEAGEGLEKPMREADEIIPSVVADMLVTGEESGRLDQIAEQVADNYEVDVNIAIMTLGDALQPVLTIFLGIIVALVVLSVGIPLISMIEQLGAGGA